ncbi:chaoptin [Cloeon dipterum]|uniref:chaoptin n=1 Tax=Cloeon dipterum TaxID=197152 RepID=UPI00322080D4
MGGECRARSRVIWWLLVLSTLWSGVMAQLVAPCPFNSMCSCKFGAPSLSIHFTTPKTLDNIKDISCVGVLFATLPEVPNGQIDHMDVVNSGLEAIDGEILGGAQIESLRMMSNQIVYVNERAFSSMEDAIRSLDLSYNELDQVPFEALRPVRSLDWINFVGNHISTLTDRDEIGGGSGGWSLYIQETLTNLLLGKNDITELPKNALAKFRHLTWLDLEYNRISTIHSGALPKSLQTLSASHNLITRFPTAAIDELNNLGWLYLRGNYLEELPEYTFRHKKRVDKLDMGENFLRSVPQNLFNGSMVVRDLNLDFNYLKTLPAQAFRGLNSGRIFLSKNRLEDMDDRTFVGLSHTLEYLDLDHNLLDKVPKALAQLKKLKYLYLASNKLKEVPEDAFDGFAGSLKAISLSGNQLTSIPKEALKGCKRLAHLNLGYNQIAEILDDDLEGWGGSLETLLLINNRITNLQAHAFQHSPRLKELSLSYNQLTDIDDDAFIDLSNTLANLEISFGLNREDFPEELLKPLTQLSWLALDNNNLRTISSSCLYTFGHLQYLNLEANKFRFLPPQLFHSNVHRQLIDVRLSYNHFEEIESGTFASLPALQTIVLTGNRIRTIRSGAFSELNSLVTVEMSDNRLSVISPKAFSSLPTLGRLKLQLNDLKEFSLGSLYNVTSPYNSLALNLSHNQITGLFPGDSGGQVYLRVLDLAHNRVPEVPINFLHGITASLRKLYLGYNKILRLDDSAFGKLDQLQVLSMPHNGIQGVRRSAFHGLPSLQILELNNNHIEQLQSEQFTRLPELRSLTLAQNHIRSLPRDVFAGTRLERLDLSNNQFVVMPSSALSEVGTSLRYLDISHNQLEHLDATMFPNTPHLLGLNLAGNRLTILPDNVFTGLGGGLLRLDLSSNPLQRANFKELFHYVQRLRHLNLANAGLRQAPHLPLPELISLNLSSNGIDEVPQGTMDSLGRLQHLDLTSNKLNSVPSHAWHSLTVLKTLDITRNPIRIITKDSFQGLHRLQTLIIDDLPKLERFDADSLTRLRLLASLRIQTWPQIERYRFRLGGVLSGVAALQKLAVRVLEPVLNDQLLGAYSPKLQEIEITGSNLKQISPDAFEGVEENYALALQIRGTQVEELPAGVFAALERVPILSLDLRDNKFTTLSPFTIYNNGSNWEVVGTKLISEGLILKGNPWTCDCSLVWLGHWLRRWLRETVQIHTVALDGAQQIQAMAREAVCTDPRTGQQTPMIDLYPEDLNCHASALSRAVGGAVGGGGGGIRHSATGLVATLVAVGVVLLAAG